jgi:hypothetical protein
MKTFRSRVEEVERDAKLYLVDRIKSIGGELKIDESKLPEMDGEPDRSSISIFVDGEYRAVESLTLYEIKRKMPIPGTKGYFVHVKANYMYESEKRGITLEFHNLVKIADSVIRFGF